MKIILDTYDGIARIVEELQVMVSAAVANEIAELRFLVAERNKEIVAQKDQIELLNVEMVALMQTIKTQDEKIAMLGRLATGYGAGLSTWPQASPPSS